jgi:iron(III) transport system permease protein
MVLVQGSSLVTLMFIFISAALRGMDSSLEDASRTSGATLATTLRNVTLPLLLPHLLAVLILGSILTIESFEVPLLLSLGARADILSTRIYFALNDATGAAPDYGAVAVLGLHFMVLSFALFYVYHRLTGGAGRFATVTGRAQPATVYPLQRWKWPVFAGVAAFLFVVSIAPFLVLLWTSFLPQYLQPGSRAFGMLSLDQYGSLFADSRLPSALANTAIVVVAAPTLAVFAALIVAWAVVRSKGSPRLRLALDFLTSASIAIPAVVAANGLLLFYLRLNRWLPDWVPLLGTSVVLVLAYAYRLAVAYRLQRAGVAQLSSEMEEAASTHGASPARAFRDIVVPLVRPSTLGAWVFLAVVAFRELSLPLIIGRDLPPYVVSTLIWKLWGNYTGQAAALGVLSVVSLIAFLLVVRWLAARGSGEVAEVPVAGEVHEGAD